MYVYLLKPLGEGGVSLRVVSVMAYLTCPMQLCTLGCVVVCSRTGYASCFEPPLVLLPLCLRQILRRWLCSISRLKDAE
jgi:hypothetical protein